MLSLKQFLQVLVVDIGKRPPLSPQRRLRLAAFKNYQK